MCVLMDGSFDEKSDDEDDGAAQCPVGGEGGDTTDSLGTDGVDDPT